MREIIFRGKRIDNGEWVEGGIYSTNESELPWCGRELMECNVYIITNDDFKKSYCLGWYEGKLKEVVPKTVGQYTGLTDKNGIKIFDGDILKGLYANGNAEVEMINGSWVGYAGKGWTDIGYVVDRVEVIGNIHDNSELLNK